MPLLNYSPWIVQFDQISDVCSQKSNSFHWILNTIEFTRTLMGIFCAILASCLIIKYTSAPLDMTNKSLIFHYISGCLHISDDHYATTIASLSDIQLMKVSIDSCLQVFKSSSSSKSVYLPSVWCIEIVANISIHSLVICNYRKQIFRKRDLTCGIKI